MDDSNQKFDPMMLMRQAKNGDSEAFGHLYEMYFTPVYRYIYLRLKNKEIANDLTQNVFLKIFQSVVRWQERNTSPLAYFFTVARNTVIDYYKKKKEIKIENPEQVLNQLPDEAFNAEELLEKKDVSETVYRAIHCLTDDQQEVIIMKFINELSNIEIAETLGKTEEAIRQIQSRALQMLREHFKQSKII